MIGLGRMGGNMTTRLEQDGHDVKTYDPGVSSTASTLGELRDQLASPRAFWMMVPAGPVTEGTFQELLGLAEPGDTIVDGGNSNFRDSQRRYGSRGARDPLRRRRRLLRHLGAEGGLLPDGRPRRRRRGTARASLPFARADRRLRARARGAAAA
jgi:hypothetical protein